MNTYKLTTDNRPKIAANIMQALKALPGDKDWQVDIHEYKSNRTRAQNRLYWLWIRHLIEVMSEPKDELHTTLRGLYLVPLYLQAPANKEQRDWVDAFVQAHEANLDLVPLIRLCSTTWANTKQFTAYLNDIEQHYMGMGIYLPHPADEYDEAMGR